MHVSEFPYTNENRSLFVFIPMITCSADSSSRRFRANGVSSLIERWSTEEGISTLRNLLDSDTPSEDAYIDHGIEPIFSLERDIPLLPLLEALGIEELLKPDAINLDSLFVNDDSVHLGNAMHRICVDVNENNTAAGASNVFYTGQDNHCLSKKISEGYDNPFAWLIYDKQRQNVLFAGAYNDFEYFFNIDDILMPSPNIPVPLDTDKDNL
ncbi:antithrombin-iii-like isoform 2 protein [Lasius niger]|uniref:Antithrombin-iii-like isoform 2 protein n=1 Tax=Lasius niger TaxID=67767 RepID=A0A0J7K1A8_LASNI|nr:antithrombin-iii-like isoform 2 protein [Lasius niger]